MSSPSGDRTRAGGCLADLPSGATGIVRRVAGGHVAAGRLAAMGLVPGRGVRVLKNDGFGPVLVMAGDTRLAVGRGLAAKVLLS